MHTETASTAPTQTSHDTSASVAADVQPTQPAVPHATNEHSDEALVPAANVKRQLVLEEISRSGEMGDSSYR